MKVGGGDQKSGQGKKKTIPKITKILIRGRGGSKPINYQIFFPPNHEIPYPWGWGVFC